MCWWLSDGAWADRALPGLPHAPLHGTPILRQQRPRGRMHVEALPRRLPAGWEVLVRAVLLGLAPAGTVRPAPARSLRSSAPGALPSRCTYIKVKACQ